MPAALFAFIAAITWGFNDFYIQKETRKFGSNLILFVFSLIAVCVLLPFVNVSNLLLLPKSRLAFLVLIPGMFSVLGTYLEFQSMKSGPISVIENLMTFEIPISVLIAIAIGERYTPAVGVIIAVDLIGFILLSPTFKSLFDFKHIRSNYFLVAMFAALFFGLTNITVGVSSQEFGFVESLFFVNIVGLGFSTFGLLFLRSQNIIGIRAAFNSIDTQLLCIAVFDLLAWIAFAFSASAGNIAITVTISQGYTVITTALGVLVNKEKLNYRQVFGIVVVTTCSILLGILS